MKLTGEAARSLLDREQIHWWYQHNRALCARLLVDAITPGITSLDLGAGVGRNGAWLAAFGDLVATAASSAPLGEYRNGADAARLVVSDLSALAFRDESFDAILSMNVLCSGGVSDPQRTVREIERVMKSGGYCCLLEPASVKAVTAGSAEGAVRSFRLSDLTGITRSAGLEIVKATRANIPVIVQGMVEPGAYRLGLGSVTSADLEWGSRAVRNFLWFLAAVERAWLMRGHLRIGASALLVARKPGNCG